MADTTLNQLTDAEIRDNPNRIAEYLANNFRAFIQPEAQ